MEIKQIGNIKGGQDGAIFGSLLFRFDTLGNCTIYDLKDLNEGQDNQLKVVGEFRLDQAEKIVPHSNAVCFGCEFFSEDDEFPLLYSNIYNNYAKEENKMIGVCLVYRIERQGGAFKSTLVQMIEIGFCEDANLWKDCADMHGVRPYGNFVVDKDTKSYWAFVMRDEQKTTRYFRFNLPSVKDGEVDGRLNIKKVVLNKEDILEYFDCNYHHFIQGASLNNGKIYSTEGFKNNLVNRPAIRIIDLKKRQETHFGIMEQGFINEPEFIDFYGDKCLYSDYEGNLYIAKF
jgi:hypothetical protein